MLLWSGIMTAASPKPVKALDKLSIMSMCYHCYDWTIKVINQNCHYNWTRLKGVVIYRRFVSLFCKQWDEVFMKADRFDTEAHALTTIYLYGPQRGWIAHELGQVTGHSSPTRPLQHQLLLNTGMKRRDILIFDVGLKFDKNIDSI